MMLSFTGIRRRWCTVPVFGQDIGLGFYEARNHPVVHFLVRPPV